MISVKVLGPGCPNCQQVELQASRAAQQLAAEFPGAEVVIEKLSDQSSFLDYGVMVTPGLVIDGRLVASGRIPSEEQILGWMRESLEAA